MFLEKLDTPKKKWKDGRTAKQIVLITIKVEKLK